MRRVMALAAAITVLLAFSAVPVMAKPTRPYTRDALEGICNEKGGRYYETDNFYMCFLPDGSMIFCDRSDGTCFTWRGQAPQLLGTIVATQGTILNQQQKTIAHLQGIIATLDDMKDAMDGLQNACAPPDLVPVPEIWENSLPDYCRLESGNLIVRVKNRGGLVEAKPSTLRVTFSTPAGPVTVDVATPVVPVGGGFIELAPVPVPAACFQQASDPNNLGPCNFTIAVDVADVVVESDEPNNNVAGVCLPLL